MRRLSNAKKTFRRLTAFPLTTSLAALLILSGVCLLQSTAFAAGLASYDPFIPMSEQVDNVFTNLNAPGAGTPSSYQGMLDNSAARDQGDADAHAINNTIQTTIGGGGFGDKFLRPLTSDNVAIHALDDNVIGGGATIGCPSSDVFLEVVASIPNSSSREMRIDWRQDLDGDGMPEIVNSIEPVSGVCANGIVQCPPGGWDNCTYKKWSIDNTTSQIVLVQATAYAGPDGMGACFCTNDNCAFNHQDEAARKNVLTSLGGGASAAIGYMGDRYVISGVEELPSDYTIRYTGYDRNRCHGNQATDNNIGLHPLPSYYGGQGQSSNGMLGDAESQAANEQSPPPVTPPYPGAPMPGAYDSNSAYNLLYYGAKQKDNVLSCTTSRTSLVKSVQKLCSEQSPPNILKQTQTVSWYQVWRSQAILQIDCSGYVGTAPPVGTQETAAAPFGSEYVRNFGVYANQCWPHSSSQDDGLYWFYDLYRLCQINYDYFDETINDGCGTALADQQDCKVRRLVQDNTMIVNNFQPVSGTQSQRQCVLQGGAVMDNTAFANASFASGCTVTSGAGQTSYTVCCDWFQQDKQYICGADNTDWGLSQFWQRSREISQSTAKTGASEFRFSDKGVTFSTQIIPPYPMDNCVESCITAKMDVALATEFTDTSHKGFATDGATTKKRTLRNCLKQVTGEWKCPAPNDEAIEKDCSCDSDFRSVVSIANVLNAAGQDMVCASQ